VAALAAIEVEVRVVALLLSCVVKKIKIRKQFKYNSQFSNRSCFVVLCCFLTIEIEQMGEQSQDTH